MAQGFWLFPGINDRKPVFSEFLLVRHVVARVGRRCFTRSSDISRVIPDQTQGKCPPAGGRSIGSIKALFYESHADWAVFHLGSSTGSLRCVIQVAPKRSLSYGNFLAGHSFVTDSAACPGPDPGSWMPDALRAFDYRRIRTFCCHPSPTSAAPDTGCGGQIRHTHIFR